MDEARVVQTPTGEQPRGPGWFILSVPRASWEGRPGTGTWCSFEAPDTPHEQVGIGVHVLAPGEANGLYHAENGQEGFLVLSGECLAIVEGQERPMRQWDYLHCPPRTRHILVGVGDGPCAILMLGSRSHGWDYLYPADPVAARHGASAALTTHDPDEAYGPRDPPTPSPAPFP